MPKDSTGIEYETIDVTPTPDGYRHMLQVIIDHTTSAKDREWAKAELARVANVTEWSK